MTCMAKVAAAQWRQQFCLIGMVSDGTIVETDALLCWFRLAVVLSLSPQFVGNILQLELT